VPRSAGAASLSAGKPQQADPRGRRAETGGTEADRRYVGWFHELDAWTEYWDIYHPETRGRFYFGDGAQERGLLSQLLPRGGRCPPPFQAWKRLALYPDTPGIDRRLVFIQTLRDQAVASAVAEIDDLVAALFSRHFGDPGVPAIRGDYLEGVFRFATDTLPPAPERAARMTSADPRRHTAGRHTLDGDIMWFAWALAVQAADVLDRRGERTALHAVMLAGIAVGCAANFAWRGNRQTRSEYRPDACTAELLRRRGIAWASDKGLATAEVHALFRIREWGDVPELAGAGQDTT
jgi:hypothetical protein